MDVGPIRQQIKFVTMWTVRNVHGRNLLAKTQYHAAVVIRGTILLRGNRLATFSACVIRWNCCNF